MFVRLQDEKIQRSAGTDRVESVRASGMAAAR